MISFEDQEFEYADHGESFTELDELDLAARLLEVTSDEELDQFLGDLIKRAGQAVGRFVRSDTGRALGSILKGAAKKALPIIGKAVGGYLGGPTGAKMGSQLAVQAGRIFGLELEGLSPEDQEFEVARRFVRFAGNAVKRATRMPSTISATKAATRAVADAARQYAPGLLNDSALASPTGIVPNGSGRWIRRGRSIVIINC